MMLARTAPRRFISTKPLSPTFGVRVSGVDTRSPASPRVAAQLRELLAEHKLLVIPGGRLSSQELGIFGRSLELGPCEEFGASSLSDGHIKRVDEDGGDAAVMTVEYGPESRPADINIWHQDHTWRRDPTRFELSYADVVPSAGGEVVFANASAAHDSLSPRLQKMLEGATCVTNLADGYQNIDIRDSKYAETMLDHRPIEQPVVCVDPATGDRSLNVNEAYSARISQVSKAESGALLRMLFQHIVQPEHCLRVAYEAGDVCLFDNHKLQHYAVSDYWPAARRIMRMSFAPEPLLDIASYTATEQGGSVGPLSSGAGGVQTTTTTTPAFLGGGGGGETDTTAHVATDLAAGLRLLDAGGQSDLCAGFFSARCPERPDLFLAPSHGTFWREATPSSFGVFSSKTRERVAGEGPLPNFPSTAVPAMIYEAFPEVQSIVHAHPRSVMSLAAAATGPNPVLPMSEPSFMFFERVASLECDFFFGDEYLQRICDGLSGGNFCVLMKNHSYIMTGRSVQECYLRSYMLEQSAAVQLSVLASRGGELPALPSHEECLAHRRSYEGYEGCPPYDGSLEWAGLVRGLDKEHDAGDGSAGWRGDGGAGLTAALQKWTAATAARETNERQEADAAAASHG